MHDLASSLRKWRASPACNERVAGQWLAAQCQPLLSRRRPESSSQEARSGWLAQQTGPSGSRRALSVARFRSADWLAAVRPAAATARGRRCRLAAQPGRIASARADHSYHGTCSAAGSKTRACGPSAPRRVPARSQPPPVARFCLARAPVRNSTRVGRQMEKGAKAARARCRLMI